MAFERESLAWERTDRLRALRPQTGPIDDMLLSRGGFASPARPRARDQQVWRMAAAAVLCVAVAGAGLLWVGEGSKAYATAVGERRVVLLDDGSRVELNTDTRLTVRMTPTGRRVKLERGEALFEVKPDKRRPFVVAAEGEELRGGDGAFNVRLSEAAVKVLVVEGEVQVRGRAGPDAAPFSATLQAGGVGVYGAEGAVSRSGAVGEAERALSWRYGAIVLAGENLREAAAEFNRYNVKQLVIADPSIAGLHLGGYFQQRDVEGFARALQSSFDVRANDTGQAIYLTRAPAARRTPRS